MNSPPRVARAVHEGATVTLMDTAPTSTTPNLDHLIDCFGPDEQIVYFASTADGYDHDHWTLCVDLRADLNVESNHEAKKLLAEKVNLSAIGIDTDPEWSCFFAYAPDRDLFEPVAAAIIDLATAAQEG